MIAQAHALGWTQLCPRAQALTPALVRRLHTEGFVVRAWGVTTEALLQQVVQAGADGMTVNFPDTSYGWGRRRDRKAGVTQSVMGRRVISQRTVATARPGDAHRHRWIPPLENCRRKGQ
jgi:hypothetical protein